MATFSTSAIVLSLCLIVFLGVSHVKGQDGSQEELQISPEQFAFLDKLLSVPAKRQLCRRPGFIYNPVSRSCKASLSVLRGRGRRF